jgi:hypothetical protein
MSALADQILSERRQAMRALLARPLLTASGWGEALVLVRVHAEWLREWLGRNCGWTLQVEGELARLRKTPGDLLDSTRGARDHTSDLPFSRRRYSLFCLALASLERRTPEASYSSPAHGFGTTVPNGALVGPSWPSLTLVTPRNSATSNLAARLRC